MPVGNTGVDHIRGMCDLIPTQEMMLAQPTLDKRWTAMIRKHFKRPDGTFKLCERNKFGFKHVMEHVIRMPRKCHNFIGKFLTLAKSKSPVGYLNFYLLIHSALWTFGMVKFSM